MVIIQLLSKISQVLKTVAEYISCIFMAAVVAIMFIQVLARVFLGTNFPWAEEIARLSMVWVAMLGFGILVKEKNLISVDFLDPFWPKWFLKYREVLIAFLLMWLCSTLVYEGYHQAMFGKGTTLSSINVSMFWPYFAIPVGSLLVMFHYIVNLIKNLGGFNEGEK